MAIGIGAHVRLPGEVPRGVPVEMLATQPTKAEDVLPYEELLADAIVGNQARFARADYVEDAWRILDPLLKNMPPVHISHGAGPSCWPRSPRPSATASSPSLEDRGADRAELAQGQVHRAGRGPRDTYG